MTIELLPVEKIALTVSLAQILRGENPGIKHVRRVRARTGAARRPVRLHQGPARGHGDAVVIIIERPPNFDRVLAAFPDADKPGVIFAYGDNIYNPSGITIPHALLAHEGIHLIRQRDGETADSWWEKYLTDDEFRYREELEAHVGEYGSQAPQLDRNYRAKLLMATAHRLIAPLYNYNPPRTLQLAMRDLKARV